MEAVGNMGAKSLQIEVYSEDHKRGSHKDCDGFRELNLTSDWEQDKCHGIFKPRTTD